MSTCFPSVALVLAVSLAIGGCSIVQPHPDLVDSLRVTRIIGGVTIQNHSRWTLPHFAAVSVTHADGRTDNTRLLAAQTGLAQYLRIAPAGAAWQIHIHWPDGATVDTMQPAVDAGGWRRVIRTADRGALLVDVTHAGDQGLVTRLEVDVEPWLRGRDWHDPEALTKAFTAVGAALTGA